MVITQLTFTEDSMSILILRTACEDEETVKKKKKQMKMKDKALGEKLKEITGLRSTTAVTTLS